MSMNESSAKQNSISIQRRNNQLNIGSGQDITAFETGFVEKTQTQLATR